MTRLHVSLFVLLLVGVTVLGSDAASGPSFASAPTDDCAQPTPAESAAVFDAADSYMSARYPTVYGGARVQRVLGDWAVVVVIPKVPADRAALILHRTPGQGWAVVGGPGTAFPPDARPDGLPAELLETSLDCGNL